jgi:hypothetical protein
MEQRENPRDGPTYRKVKTQDFNLKYGLRNVLFPYYLRKAVGSRVPARIPTSDQKSFVSHFANNRGSFAAQGASASTRGAGGY